MHNGSQSVRVPSMQCRGRGVCANDTVCVSACVSAGVFRPQGRALGDEVVTNLCPRASLSDAVLIACTRTRQHRMERTHRGHRPHRCPQSSRSSPARAPGLAQSALAQQAQVPPATPERRARAHNRMGNECTQCQKPKRLEPNGVERSTPKQKQTSGLLPVCPLGWQRDRNSAHNKQVEVVP